MDLASQGVLALADRHIKRHDARYPVGRARLEALGVLGCATIMSMAAVEVIQFSVRPSCVKSAGQRAFVAAQKFLPHDVASV